MALEELLFSRCREDGIRAPSLYAQYRYDPGVGCMQDVLINQYKEASSLMCAHYRTKNVDTETLRKEKHTIICNMYDIRRAAFNVWKKGMAHWWKIHAHVMEDTGGLDKV